MKCAGCRAEVSQPMKFCGNCGLALNQCARCGAHNPSEFSFCGQCGIALVQTPPRPAEQHLEPSVVSPTFPPTYPSEDSEIRREEAKTALPLLADSKASIAYWKRRWPPTYRLLRDERSIAALASIVFGLLFSSPILNHLSERGTTQDWSYNIGLQWVAWHTIVHFHQLPLWNPYKCGGMPMLGNPQSHIVTPWFVFTLLLGPFTGLHLEIPIHIALAWGGGYLLARVVGIRPLAAAASACVFAGSSWFYLRMGVGHVYALGYVYAPWAMAMSWRASERASVVDSALAGLALALTFLEGSPYTTIFTAVTIGLVLLPLAIMQRSARPLGVLLLTIPFAIGFSAIKLLPGYLVSLQHPRPAPDIDVNNLALIGEALFSRAQDSFRAIDNGWGFWEVGAYLGLFSVPAILGLLTPRRAAPWIFAAAVLLFLARGDDAWPPLWPLLHQMPVFSSLRLPSRFLIYFVMVSGVLAGFGFEWLASRSHPYGATAAAALAVVAVFDFVLVAPPSLYVALLDPIGPVASAVSFRQSPLGDRPDDMLTPAMANAGVVYCYEYTDWASSVRTFGASDYRGEQFMVGAGTVALSHWTPNELSYSVKAQAAAVMVVNQNYDPSWRLETGIGKVIDDEGLLAVLLPAGQQTVVLKYMSVPMLVGVAITILTIVTTIFFAWRERRVRRR